MAITDAQGNLVPYTVALKYVGKRKEAPADAAITPGHLIKRTATGVAVNNVAGTFGVGTKTFAVENGLVGKGIDAPYVAGEQVLFIDTTSGDEINALLPAAAA